MQLERYLHYKNKQYTVLGLFSNHELLELSQIITNGTCSNL
jgi:hypothetical protein